jgi:hypothetical protein
MLTIGGGNLYNKLITQLMTIIDLTIKRMHYIYDIFSEEPDSTYIYLKKNGETDKESNY